MHGMGKTFLKEKEKTMSCGDDEAGCGTGACCVPRPLSVSNALGFTGGHTCCALPCIDFPPHNIQICMIVNSSSVITIETGCNVTTVSDTCKLKFTPAGTLSSWGKSCRKVSWSRYVPSFSYIRIRICSNGNDCTSGCEDRTVENSGYTEYSAKNALTRFEVDGRDFTQFLLDVASGVLFPGDAGMVPGSCLVKAACITPLQDTLRTDDRCCQWYHTGEEETQVVSWASSLNNLPIGTEFVFGPIGQVGL